VSVSIRNCREFIVLAEQLSFTRAAHLLGMTQPVLSKHIALIERELGVRLIDRGGSSLELTPAGTRFLEGCATITQTYDATLGEIKRARSHRPYTLSLTGPFIYPHLVRLVNSVITRCRTEHPLEVSMSAEPPTGYLDMLREGKADIAFEIVSSKTDMDEFPSESVMLSHIVMATRKDHPLAQSGSEIPVSALNDALIHAPDGPIHRSARQRLLDICEDNGVGVRLRLLRCGPFDLRLDQLGDEVAILADTVTEYYATPELHLLRLQGEDCTFEMRAFWTSGSANPAIPLFLSHLRAVIG